MPEKPQKRATPTYFSSNKDLYAYTSHHRDAIEASYVIDPNFIHKELLEQTSKKIVVFVCFSNRSGSNLFLDALGRIGFGCSPGDEFFNAEAIYDHVKEFAFESFEDHLAFIVKLRGLRKHVFLKIGPHQLFWLANSGLLTRYFRHTRYVLVERRDKVAQAVSLYLADQTGSYLRTVDSEGSAREAVPYSSEEILKRLKHIMDVTGLFEYFFELHSLSFHRICYEDLDADPVQALRAMSLALSMADDFPPRWELAMKQPAGILRQSDELNREFVGRFRREFAIDTVQAKQQSGASDADD
jgi:LPS sulfotransferase NodH